MVLNKMIDSRDVQSWDYNKLEAWLSSLSSLEDDSFDFKERYENGVAPEKIRKWFSAFANSKGGCLFFGINDSKQIVGVDEDNDVITKINQKLRDNLDPPIEFGLINAIEIPSSNPKKLVIIFKIEPSIFFNRPHISDERIYIRQKGESVPIKSLKDLRGGFFTSRFHPEHIAQMEFELDKVKKYEYQSSSIDVFYLKNLKQFLFESENSETDPTTKATMIVLRNDFQSISSLIDTIEKESAGLRSASTAGQVSMPTETTQKYDDLAQKVEDFINRFKGVYRI